MPARALASDDDGGTTHEDRVGRAHGRAGDFHDDVSHSAGHLAIDEVRWRLPIRTEPTPSAPLMLAAGQACWSMVARQAGIPPIRTLTAPGPGESGAP